MARTARGYGSGYLYTQGANPFEGPSDDGLYRFSPPLYDVAEPIAVSPLPATIVGADAGSVYFSSADDPATWGLYRVSHASLAVEQVSSGPWFGSMWTWSGTQTPYVNDATYLWRVPETGNAQQITAVPTGECTTHQVFAHEGWVYTATYNSLGGENLVWRVRE